MTVWKPLTCDCILEYDNNRNFLRAFSKCKDHEKLEGKRLLSQVVKDNISKSKAYKPRKSFWSRLRGK